MKVFDKPGKQNTEECCRIAVKEAIDKNMPIVASTTTGYSALTLTQIAKEMGYEGKIIVVTHAYGSAQPGTNRMSDENRSELTARGAVLVTAAHALSGAERSLSGRFNGVYPLEIVANALRMLSQGIKVVVEIGSMALDAGVLPYGVDVVALGGTGAGLDTAVIMRPAHANILLETNIHEILCMPY